MEIVGSCRLSMEVLQTASEQFNGELYQLVADDKGTVGIICFGLPHRTSDDNPLRAVRVAAHVRDELVKRALNPGIGIATGKIFCGPVGNSRRREYTIHGSSVNFSARSCKLPTATSCATKPRNKVFTHPSSCKSCRVSI